MSDRIHVLSNGRSPAKKSGDFITRGEAEAMVLEERAENEQMVKWYMRQLPELVAKMLGDALAVNGLVMQPPKAPEPEIACAVCGNVDYHAVGCTREGAAIPDPTEGDSTEPAA